MHQFICSGQSGRELSLVLSGEDTWATPAPELERIRRLCSSLAFIFTIYPLQQAKNKDFEAEFAEK